MPLPCTFNLLQRQLYTGVLQKSCPEVVEKYKGYPKTADKAQWESTCSKLTIETPEQGLKYVQS